MKARLLSGRVLCGEVLYGPGDLLPEMEGISSLIAEGRAEGLNAVLEAESGIEDVSMDYEARTMRDLTELARSRGIEVVKGMSKAELIGILRASLNSTGRVQLSGRSWRRISTMERSGSTRRNSGSSTTSTA